MNKTSTIIIFIKLILVNSVLLANENNNQKSETVNQQEKPLANELSKVNKAQLSANPEIPDRINPNEKEIIIPKPIQASEKTLKAQIPASDTNQNKTLELDTSLQNNTSEVEKDTDKQRTKVEPAEITYSDNKQKGLAIIMELDRRDTGWVDNQAELKMLLKNRHGDEHTRSLKMKLMEVPGDGDKSLSIFNSPRDIKGTAFLSFTHALDPDEQWLFLPAVKRVKRISSRNKSGPYLGSEFAFEDLSSFEVKKYKYNYLHDEVLDGKDCFVIESFPQYQHSGYTRIITWVEKKRYIILKMDYYDRKNSLLKTQTFHGYNQYLEQFWRPDEMRMVNHNNNKSTQLFWENYQFRKGLTKRDFDRNSLKRAR